MPRLSPAARARVSLDASVHRRPGDSASEVWRAFLSWPVEIEPQTAVVIRAMGSTDSCSAVHWDDDWSWMRTGFLMADLVMFWMLLLLVRQVRRELRAHKEESQAMFNSLAQTNDTASIQRQEIMATLHEMRMMQIMFESFLNIDCFNPGEFWEAMTKEGNLGYMSHAYQSTYAKGLPWGESGDIAARSGNIPVLHWLNAHGCEWTASLYSSATRSGRPDVIRWIIENSSAENCSRWKAQPPPPPIARNVDSMEMLEALFGEGFHTVNLSWIAFGLIENPKMPRKNFEYLQSLYKDSPSDVESSTIPSGTFNTLVRVLSKDDWGVYLPFFSGRVRGGLTCGIIAHAGSLQKWDIVAWLRDPTKPGGVCLWDHRLRDHASSPEIVAWLDDPTTGGGVCPHA